MANIQIDRLTLKLSGISQQEGQHLARAIADGLADASLAAETAHSLDVLKVTVTVGSGDNLDRLAQQILTELLQQINRTLA